VASIDGVGRSSHCKNQKATPILTTLLQSALQPLVGFRPAQLSLSILSKKVLQCRCQRHVKLPTWRRTCDLERSNFRPKRPPASEATLTNPAEESGTIGEKWPRILPKVVIFTSLLGSFTCRKARHGTDGFTSPPKEGVLRIIFVRKIRRLRPGLNTRTWVPKASTLPVDHRSR
jgi:hypothetical protein